MLNFTKPNKSPDFEDCFSGKNAFPKKSPRELAEYALANSPLWFRFMFSLRQKLGRLVGLRTETENGENPDITFLLSMPELQNNEEAYEAGIADKHLDFTIRISKEAGQVHLATQIWFNHWSGRLYLMLVKPFHNMIVSQWVRTLGGH